jgi:hypothetical protein
MRSGPDASSTLVNGSDGVLRKKPITGIAGCARAATGHQAAAPPSRLMNRAASRRTSGFLPCLADGPNLTQLRVP